MNWQTLNIFAILAIKKKHLHKCKLITLLGKMVLVVIQLNALLFIFLFKDTSSARKNNFYRHIAAQTAI